MRKIVGVLLLSGACFGAQAEEVKSVVIATDVPFTTPDAIDGAVKKECDLPNKLSTLMREQMTAAGIEAKAVNELKPDSGENVLMLEIAAAAASGNAFTGKKASATVTGKLLKKGQQVAAFVDMRDTRGGAYGNLKGNCSLIGRSIEAIAKDTAGWLKAPVDGAKLGDAK